MMYELLGEFNSVVERVAYADDPFFLAEGNRRFELVQQGTTGSHKVDIVVLIEKMSLKSYFSSFTLVESTRVNLKYRTTVTYFKVTMAKRT